MRLVVDSPYIPVCFIWWVSLHPQKERILIVGATYPTRYPEPEYYMLFMVD